MSERTKAAIDALNAETYGAEWVPDVARIAIDAADAADRRIHPGELEALANALQIFEDINTYQPKDQHMVGRYTATQTNMNRARDLLRQGYTHPSWKKETA